MGRKTIEEWVRRKIEALAERIHEKHYWSLGESRILANALFRAAVPVVREVEAAIAAQEREDAAHATP